MPPLSQSPFALSLCLPLVVVVAVVGCASSAETPQIKPPVDGPQSVCSVDGAQRSSRLPTPKTPSCVDKADVAADARACDAGEADACYRVGFCLSGQWLGTEASAERSAAVTDMVARLQKACSKGITEACVLRAGVRIDAGETEAATCDDLVRACQLGDERDGCTGCLKAGCG